MLSSGFGGAERLFVDLCRAFADKGLQVQAICRNHSRAATILEEDENIELHSVPVMGIWDPLAVKRIQFLLRQHGSQLVQAHLARGALLAGKACRKTGLPLLVTSHNYIDPKYYRHVRMLVPPTEDQYRYYLNKGIESHRLQLIRHFSPLQAMPAVNNEGREKLRFSALGRLVHKKGFDLLISAFAKIQAEQSRELELHIGGTGPEQENLQAQIEMLGLEKNIKLVGWINDAQGFIRDSDIFVLPSRDEPFGIVVIEAMAAGVPIVSTDCFGPRETLDNDSAWLCKKDDRDALAAAMQSALQSAADRLAKTETASRRFTENYSSAAVIPRFIELYEKLVRE